MFYTSTRDSSVKVTSAQAIAQGISKEGGLFVPESIPKISLGEIDALSQADYVTRASTILKRFLTDFTDEEVEACVAGAYAPEKFSAPEIAPLVGIDETENILELWHGPTCAFKDMALQLLPHLMTVAAKKTAHGKTIVILVATSGDTGKAALEGFKDVPNTKILVFYPNDGVSPMQKLQMTTQEGENVSVCAINGNFDDAQSGVKAIFTNPEIAEKLEEKNMMFSSANSINWGRLVPQIVYYFSAYCDLLVNSSVRLGDPVNIVVPTGNFGNILAAYYAKEMGLPVKKLICASNSNNVLTDFLTTGTYDRNRAFYTTTSPSMDILISSNLERLLYHMSGGDAKKVKGYMEALAQNGTYTVDATLFHDIKALFKAGCCTDEQVDATIKSMYQENGYLCDTHTAVAVKVYEEYRNKTEDPADTVVASTASPFKFSKAVLNAVSDDAPAGDDEFEMVTELSVLTSNPAPAPLTALQNKEQRFSQVCNKEEMTEMVFELLKL